MMKTNKQTILSIVILFSLFVLIPETLSDDRELDTLSILDQAFRTIKIPKQEISLINHSNQYHISLGRNPIIGDALYNPFFLPPYLQIYSSRLNGSSDSITPQNTFVNALELAGGFEEKRFAETKTPSRPLIDIFEDMHVRFERTPLSPGTRQYLENQINAFPEGLEEVMVYLCEALLESATNRQEAIKSLTTKERHKIIDSPLNYMMENGHIRDIHSVNPDQLEIAAIMRKIDIQKLCEGMQLLTRAVEITRPKLEWIHKRTIAIQNDELFLEFKSPIGLIMVGGPGINRYDRDAALIVDIDGSDVYCNNAGGCFPTRGGVALLLDVGGNDIYIDQRIGMQGSGVLGIGLLVDYHGSDVYIGGDWSQGAGYAGIGMIYDEKGSDSYHAGVLSQGSGVFGVGLCVDVDGHDFISCDGMGQGFGSTMGMGFLINVYGRDNYTIGNADSQIYDRDSGFGQGASVGFVTNHLDRKANLWGGLGLLVDGHGNDTYFSNYHSQGAASCLSAAALIDCQGNDLYDGRFFSQGYAANLGSAMLIDQNGDDRYFSTKFAQACGRDRGAAFLLDYNGNDIYRLSNEKGQAYSTGEKAFALHIDYNGDDRYTAKQFAQGNVLRPQKPISPPVAIFINHYGNDEYSEQHHQFNDRADNLTWHHPETAIGFDSNLPPHLYFADKPSRSMLHHFEMNPVKNLGFISENNLLKLGSRNIFDRYHAGSEILLKGENAFQSIIENIELGHAEFKRALEEAIIALLISTENTDHLLSEFDTILQSLDPLTRVTGLHLLKLYNVKSATETIREMLYDDEAYVRKLAIDTVVQFNDIDAVPILESMASHDKSPFCRLNAVSALTRLNSASSFPVIREALRDPDRKVQYTAIESLVAYKRSEIIRPLEMLMATDDIYIQRIAAKSLIEMGEISGIPVLIHSLQFRTEDNNPSDERNDVYEFLRKYTGLNVSDTQTEWQTWWQEQSSDFDLSQSIDAFHEFEKIYKSVKDNHYKTVFKAFKELKINYPAYKGMDNQFAAYFRAIVDNDQNQLSEEMSADIYGFLADVYRESEIYIKYIQSLIRIGKNELAIETFNSVSDQLDHSSEVTKIQNQINKIQSGE